MTDIRIPDLAAPIVGWRAWNVIPAATPEPRLIPFIGELVGWPARTAARAVCTGAGTWAAPDHGPIPDRACSCGLYAHKDLPGLWAGHAPRLDDPHAAWGTVALWGRVLEYADGWRAEIGAPTHIWAPAHHIDRLRDRYGIPVEPVDRLMETKPPETGVAKPRAMPVVDRTGGRGDAFFMLHGEKRGVWAVNGGPYDPEKFPLSLPIETVRRLTFNVPRGHWQRAICIGVFHPDGCQPHRWMDPQGACTPARVASLTDVLSRLAGRGCRVKRISGRWGGEWGATYRVTDVFNRPVAAPKPHVRGYKTPPQWRP